MSHDSRHINALAKGYVTNFLLHLGGDANYNLRQKKHVSRFLTDRGLDPKKFAWFVQTQINGWNCATTPQVADYGDKAAQQRANRKAILDFIKGERKVLRLQVGETVDDDWKKKTLWPCSSISTQSFKTSMAAKQTTGEGIPSRPCPRSRYASAASYCTSIFHGANSRDDCLPRRCTSPLTGTPSRA